MKKSLLISQFQLLICTFLFASSCNNQHSVDFIQQNATETQQNADDAQNVFGAYFIEGVELKTNNQEANPYGNLADTTTQIAGYVRNILQDKAGNLWFGTNQYGVCRYDGESVSYFSSKNGLSGDQVTDQMEDSAGNLWFTTYGGVSKYDGTTFTNYTTKDGLSHEWAWSVLEDSDGVIWVGTMQGLCRLDGTKFTPFPLPLADVEITNQRFSSTLVWHMIEDSKGNIWYGMDGVGVTKFDGKNYTHLTMEDGLCDNTIDCIVEDSKGNFWFGSRFGGVSRYDGKTFTNFSEGNGIGSNEVIVVYEDSSGLIWFSSEGYGVYQYDGETLRNFNADKGLGVGAVQTIYEDKEGRLWAGGGGGLYRFDGMFWVNVTKNGPWN